MKKCSNGHYYADNLEYCPYCPPDSKSEKVDNEEKTKIADNNNASSTDKTKIFDGSDNINQDKTKIFGGDNVNQDKTKIFGGNINKETKVYNKIHKERNSEKTFIDLGPEAEKNEEKSIRATRKLVGWLVSYTIDSMGVDFRLYEGKTLIGSDPECEVTVPNDKVVSGKNATILFRNGKFKIKDEFSTNGTYLNNEIVEDETPQLNDNDIIKVGKTIFKFKIAL